MSQALFCIKSWNVNGIRACAKKGFFDWLDGCGADLVGVQEVRAQAEQLDESFSPDGWERELFWAERKGYSGVGLWSRQAADKVECELGEARFDVEGRVQIAHFGALSVANVYFPNGKGKERDNARVPYKLDFYRCLFDRLQGLRDAGQRVVVMGDFNTAHLEIDLARPKENRKTSGFLLEECEELDRWLAAGYVDTFREFHQGPGHYSWWSQRGGARARNVGWRIDYIYCCPETRPFLRNACIDAEVMGSDHCPIGIALDRSVLERGN